MNVRLFPVILNASLASYMPSAFAFEGDFDRAMFCLKPGL